ncbi:MAG: adenylate cyclase [Lentisphaeria bacterium]|jgi:adenylate cyclase
MATEIERKFLVTGTAWKNDTGVSLTQGYLCRDEMTTLRVRVAGDKSFLTIKSATSGISRAEFEYEIPISDAEHLLKLCDGALIRKTRYTVIDDGNRWEVDEFHGVNEGLVIAEIELESEDQVFARPDWLGREVSDDPRYYNASLVKNPYLNWCPA